MLWYAIKLNHISYCKITKKSQIQSVWVTRAHKEHSLLGNLAQQYIRIAIAGRHSSALCLHTPSWEGLKICHSPFSPTKPELQSYLHTLPLLQHQQSLLESLLKADLGKSSLLAALVLQQDVTTEERATSKARVSHHTFIRPTEQTQRGDNEGSGSPETTLLFPTLFTRLYFSFKNLK